VTSGRNRHGPTHVRHKARKRKHSGGGTVSFKGNDGFNSNV